ncbi:hypothetical protein PUN28_017462 [Cardiocondyla obscurior]|uniref:Uncharacterized protein n=1 Tax=Cardiocondyla obscurior TaxID=286306 RepID=A0AAW2EMS6_9HYME
MGKMKRLPRPVIKIKRLSRKKKMILQSNEVKKYVRWKWERHKMHAILDTAMHLNTLKITADPQIDIDFVREMSTVSIYDHDYRTPIQEMPEDSVYVRSDVMRELNNLNIDHESEDNCNINIPQQDIESDILQKTSILYISDNNEPNMYDRISNIIL